MTSGNLPYACSHYSLRSECDSGFCKWCLWPQLLSTSSSSVPSVDNLQLLCVCLSVKGLLPVFVKVGLWQQWLWLLFCAHTFRSTMLRPLTLLLRCSLCTMCTKDVKGNSEEVLHYTRFTSIKRLWCIIFLILIIWLWESCRLASAGPPGRSLPLINSTFQSSNKDFCSEKCKFRSTLNRVILDNFLTLFWDMWTCVSQVLCSSFLNLVYFWQALTMTNTS